PAELSPEADDARAGRLTEAANRAVPTANESSRRRSDMADIVAIGYPDETTAALAMHEAEQLAEDLILQPDAIAAIVRGKDGKFKVTTNHHEVAGGATWGMFWGFLFGLLFFVPFLGMAVGAGMGALSGKLGK